MKLYDMGKDEWRNEDFERGDRWRSNVIRECVICYIKTNNWVMGGYPGMGPRLICPGNKYQEHNEIIAYLTKSHDLGLEIKFFEKILNESPELDEEKSWNMIDNLSVQKELLEVKIDQLRGLFPKRLDDIVGLDSSANIKPFNSGLVDAKLHAYVLEDYPYLGYLNKSKLI